MRHQPLSSSDTDGPEERVNVASPLLPSFVHELSMVAEQNQTADSEGEHPGNPLAVGKPLIRSLLRGVTSFKDITFEIKGGYRSTTLRVANADHLFRKWNEVESITIESGCHFTDAQNIFSAVWCSPPAHLKYFEIEGNELFVIPKTSSELLKNMFSTLKLLKISTLNPGGSWVEKLPPGFAPKLALNLNGLELVEGADQHLKRDQFLNSVFKVRPKLSSLAVEGQRYGIRARYIENSAVAQNFKNLKTFSLSNVEKFPSVFVNSVISSTAKLQRLIISNVKRYSGDLETSVNLVHLQELELERVPTSLVLFFLRACAQLKTFRIKACPNYFISWNDELLSHSEVGFASLLCEKLEIRLIMDEVVLDKLLNYVFQDKVRSLVLGHLPSLRNGSGRGIDFKHSSVEMLVLYEDVLMVLNLDNLPDQLAQVEVRLVHNRHSSVITRWPALLTLFNRFKVIQNFQVRVQKIDSYDFGVGDKRGDQRRLMEKDLKKICSRWTLGFWDHMDDEIEITDELDYDKDFNSSL